MWRPDGTIRKKRRSSNEPGQAHEFTFSCYKNLRLLTRERVRQWFINALDQTRTRYDLELWAYVIMPEHVHILLLPRQPNYSVATILQAIKQSVSRRAIRFLREHRPDRLAMLSVRRPDGRSSYRFWQAGGGYDRNITDSATAWRVVDYIHNNPLRRDLADHPTDWAWSSARWYAGEDDVKLAMDATPPDP